MKKTILFLLALVLLNTQTFAQQKVGLEVGSKAPDFTEQTYTQGEFSLSAAYAQGPVVLIFYRGGWCMYCNLQLQEYQTKLSEFDELGIQVVALSVDTTENAAKTVKEKELGFNVISNPNANTLQDYNLVFHVPEDLAKMYKEEYNIDLEAASGRSDYLIAIPATYIIDTSGTIIFASANKDYKVRISAQEVLAFLKSHAEKK